VHPELKLLTREPGLTSAHLWVLLINNSPPITIDSCASYCEGAEKFAVIHQLEKLLLP
jgi:hypothetical protein